MGLVSPGQSNGHPQGDQPELPGLQGHFLGGAEVDPVGLTLYIAQLRKALCKIFYLDFFHVKLQNMIIYRNIWWILYKS